MSWADDIRCLYCDGRLPLYRKITNGQFCSGAHRKAYWQEHERLAVERLHQTHDSLRAYRPEGAVEAILGPGAADDESGQVLSVDLVSQATGALSGSPIATHTLPPLDVDPSVAQLVPPPVFTLPHWLPDYLAIVDDIPMEPSDSMRWPVVDWTPRESSLIAFPRVSVTKPAVRDTKSLAFQAEPGHPHSLYPKVDAAHPRVNLSLAIAQDGVPGGLQNNEPQPAIEPKIPDLAGLLALPLVQMREKACPSVLPISDAALEFGAQLPLNTLHIEASEVRSALTLGGLHPLPLANVPVAGNAVRQDGLDAMDLRASLEGAQLVLLSPQGSELKLPRLNLAAGSRYRVETQQGPAPKPEAEIDGFATMPPHISLPEHKAKVRAASASASHPSSVPAAPAKPQAPAPDFDLEFEPSAVGMLPLACNAQPSLPSIEMRPAPAALTLPQPLETKLRRPDSKLEPIDVKPASDAIAAARPVQRPSEVNNVEVNHVHVWAHAIDFWNRAPRDLKLLVFALPVLLGLALHPSLPKVRVAAPAAANGIERNVTRAFKDQLVSVRQTMVDRAAVALDEDFRTGLDEWVSRDDATAEWSFDATGFVRPGPLALYRPSMNLTDYQMQFLGVLDKQALSWVVRAADYDNFYVVKLETLKSGPLPTIGVVRYAVVNGKSDARGDTIAAIDARADMLYRVRMDVRGDDFALTINGQMVDSWTEPRLRRGGIGFFSARGEESRLRWVQVTHQYDMLGRLCAYLAPYNIPTTSGSWQQ